MDPLIKTTLQTLIVVAMFLILFVMALPALLPILDQRTGKIFYGVFATGGILLSVRLRQISRRL